MNPIKLYLFAEILNAEVKDYVSWKQDPIAGATDAFMIKWTVRQAYAFPPFYLIPRCPAKVEKEGGGGANNCNFIKADSSFLPNSTEHDGERSNSFAPSRQLLLSPEGKIHPLIVNKTLKLVVWKASARHIRRGYKFTCRSMAQRDTIGL